MLKSIKSEAPTSQQITFAQMQVSTLYEIVSSAYQGCVVMRPAGMDCVIQVHNSGDGVLGGWPNHENPIHKVKLYTGTVTLENA